VQNAFDCNATLQRARVNVTKRTTTGTQVRESKTSGVLSGADFDLSFQVTNTGGISRPSGSASQRIGIGNSQYDRKTSPPASTGWQRKDRPSPDQTTAFGSNKLRDGTSAGAAAIYTDIRERGVEALPQGSAHRLDTVLDMAAVARAAGKSAAEQARYAQVTATLSIWVGQRDGYIYRTNLHTSSPNPRGSGPPIEEDTVVDVTDNDGALTVGAPR